MSRNGGDRVQHKIIVIFKAREYFIIFKMKDSTLWVIVCVSQSDKLSSMKNVYVQQFDEGKVRGLWIVIV